MMVLVGGSPPASPASRATYPRLSTQPCTFQPRMFFSFDGIDGTGKSTQLHLFCDSLREAGCDVVVCRDPGSTLLGERIREILLTTDATMQIGLRCEMLLYMAARAQLVDEVIRPALDAGKVVVSDRFLLANIVYQGYAGGLHPDAIRQVGEFTINGVFPDCIFLLDMSPEAADRRLNRPLDRIESQGPDYRRRLREGFLSEARRPDSRVHVVDAEQPINSVREEIWRIALPVVLREASAM
jgi:dTMP kinase